MGNENMAGLRLAYVAASVALATAGIYVATSEGQATAPAQGNVDSDVTASISTRIERTMLTARVVSSGDIIPLRAAGEPNSAAEALEAPAEPEGDSIEEPSAPEDSTTEDGLAKSDLGPKDSVEETTPRTAPRQSPPAGTSTAPSLGAHRNRMSAANVLARQIAVQESTVEAQRFLGGGALRSPVQESESDNAPPSYERVGDEPTQSGEGAPRRLVRVDDRGEDEADWTDDDEPTGPRSLGSDAMDKEDRHLLFVWDSSIVLDEARSAELLTFAGHRGYDTLAVEATGVGYNDAALTEAFARFTVDATDAGIETFALIGYPWFTVAANAGLPGQPTSSLEGIAVLDVIAGTGLFDGVVDDSHPYGVVYDVNGESRNWLFDEPAAASLDLQAWLRSAKNAIGDLPLIKTTPFWYDSHPALQEMVNIEGEGYLTLGHLVATEVDAMAVLAYRDTLGGQNGLLALVAGEMSMGPSIITLETGDLGADLDYLTFQEEGLVALEVTTQEVVDQLTGEWAFAGVGVHHYEPVEQITTELAEVQSFGFVALESGTAAFGSLIDAYDSSLGTYTDQMTYNAELDTMTGIGVGALVSNGNIKLEWGALVHGDARAGQGTAVTQVDGTVITGEAVSISTPVEVPVVNEADSSGGQRLSIGWNDTETVTGDAVFSRVKLNSYAGLTILGPATVIIDDLRLNSNAYVWADTTNGPVTILLNDRLDLGSSSFMAPTSLQARDLTIRYAGTRQITLGFEARLLTDIVAPNATIELGSSSEIYGRATAKSLILRSEAKLHLDIDLLR